MFILLVVASRDPLCAEEAPNDAAVFQDILLRSEDLMKRMLLVEDRVAAQLNEDIRHEESNDARSQRLQHVSTSAYNQLKQEVGVEVFRLYQDLDRFIQTNQHSPWYDDALFLRVRLCSGGLYLCNVAIPPLRELADPREDWAAQLWQVYPVHLESSTEELFNDLLTSAGQSSSLIKEVGLLPDLFSFLALEVPETAAALHTQLLWNRRTLTAFEDEHPAPPDSWSRTQIGFVAGLYYWIARGLKKLDDEPSLRALCSEAESFRRSVRLPRLLLPECPETSPSSVTR